MDSHGLRARRRLTRAGPHAAPIAAVPVACVARGDLCVHAAATAGRWASGWGHAARAGRVVGRPRRRRYVVGGSVACARGMTIGRGMRLVVFERPVLCVVFEVCLCWVESCKLPACLPGPCEERKEFTEVVEVAQFRPCGRALLSSSRVWAWSPPTCSGRRCRSALPWVYRHRCPCRSASTSLRLPKICVLCVAHEEAG